MDFTQTTYRSEESPGLLFVPDTSLVFQGGGHPPPPHPPPPPPPEPIPPPDGTGTTGEIDTRHLPDVLPEPERFLDVRVCGLGFDEISNDFVAIIRVRTSLWTTRRHRPLPISAGGTCGTGTDLIVRFFLTLEGSVFRDALREEYPRLLYGACPSFNGDRPSALNPDLWLYDNGLPIGDGRSDVIHVGTTFIRVSTDSETDLCYRATVPFDSLRPRADPGDLRRSSTVEYLLQLVRACEEEGMAPLLRCCVQKDLGSYFRPTERRYPFDAYRGNDRLGEESINVWRRARACEHNWIWYDYDQAFRARTYPSGSIRVRLPSISNAVLQPSGTGMPAQQEWGRTVLASAAPPVSPTTALLLPDGRLLAWGPPGFEEEEWSLTTALLEHEGDYGAFGYRPPREVPSGSENVSVTMSVFVQRTLAFTGSPSADVWSELSLPVASAVSLEPYALRFPHGGLERVEINDGNGTNPHEWMDLEYYVRDESSPTGFSITDDLTGKEQVAVAYEGPDISKATACLLPDGDLGIFGGGVNTPRYSDGTHLPAGAQQVAVFYARSNSWGALSPAMKRGRSLGGCVVMGDGRVMLMGGETDVGDQEIGYLTEGERIARGRSLAEDLGGDEDVLPIHVVPLRKENLDLEFFYPQNRQWESLRNAAPSISEEPFFRAPDHRPQLIQLPDGRVLCCTPTQTESVGNSGHFNLYIKDKEGKEVVGDDLPARAAKKGYSPHLLTDTSERRALLATRVFVPGRNKWEVLPAAGPSTRPSTSLLLPLYPSTDYQPAILAVFNDYWLLRPDEQTTPSWHQLRLKGTPETVSGLTSAILADGTVAIVGGHSVDSTSGTEKPFRSIELYDTTDGAVTDANNWNPANGTWRNGPRLKIARPFSPTVVLLPDGRVWISGGEFDPVTDEEVSVTAEFFEPDYLHRGPRPEFRLRESSATYGQLIEIQLRAGWSDTDIDLDRIGIVRIGACVDGYICDQRYVALGTPENIPGDKIDKTIRFQVRTPPNGNIAPPGVYMMFLHARTTGAISHAQFIESTC